MLYPSTAMWLHPAFYFGWLKNYVSATIPLLVVAAVTPWVKRSPWNSGTF